MNKIGNFSFESLKEEYKTPLYIFDEEKLIDNINIFKNNFKSDLFETNIAYASKAFLTKYMAKLINKHNLSIDCVSNGEVYTALKANYPSDKIILHGNNKTIDELMFAIKNKVGTIVLDNLYEAKLLMSITNINYKPNIFLRINLNIDVDTHKYIKTSNTDSKFGVSLNDETIKIIKKLINNKNFKFKGLHSHIGSQILDENYFYEHIKIILKEYYNLKTKENINLSEVNIGGGFGIKYTNDDKKIDMSNLLTNMIKTLNKYIKQYNLNINKVHIEPGRSIVGNAGYTLYTVNQLKTTPNINYVFVDGSMNDNIRTSLYNAKYDCFIVGKKDDVKTTNYKIAGKACESGDIIIEDIKLPKVLEEDLLVVKSTGAYNYSMASNYNRLKIPAVVFINKDEKRLVVKRQTLDDLIKYDL